MSVIISQIDLGMLDWNIKIFILQNCPVNGTTTMKIKIIE